mmetsp:Transcript_96108/g.214040  ORF Transcript_96108/g.214040 Transcript_96108/m.214040 type:complete len:231 (+) Transcript_96108:70-762(+)
MVAFDEQGEPALLLRDRATEEGDQATSQRYEQDAWKRMEMKDTPPWRAPPPGPGLWCQRATAGCVLAATMIVLLLVLIPYRASFVEPTSAVTVVIHEEPPGEVPGHCWTVFQRSLVLSDCVVGSPDQTFTLRDGHMVVWPAARPELCLRASRSWSGFDSCDETDSSQSFEFPAQIEPYGPIANCWCTPPAACPLPCYTDRRMRLFLTATASGRIVLSDAITPTTFFVSFS